MPSSHATCKHGRRRSRCKDCGGNQICEHGRRRSQCKDCGGSSICKHGRRRNQCKECKGSGICKHRRERRMCTECGGSGMCHHETRKDRCKYCVGNRICVHERPRKHCEICVPSSQNGRGARITAARLREAAAKTDFDAVGYFSSLSSLAAHFDIDVQSIGPSLCPFFTDLPCPAPGCVMR